MPEELTGSTVRPARLAGAAAETARRWRAEATAGPADARSRRVDAFLRDPAGLDFVIGLLDRVARPEDRAVAARALEVLCRAVPSSLPWYLRLAVRVVGGLAPVLPTFLVPAVRRILRGMLGPLILDESPRRLGARIGALSRIGAGLDLALLGRPVTGEADADRYLARAHRLLARPDVGHLSIAVRPVAGPESPCVFEPTVERVVERLAPLYDQAASSPTPVAITLEVSRFRDLDLTIAVFTRLLERPGLAGLEAGIALPAGLPDSLGALQELTAWARARRSAGGAPIRIRISADTDLATERVEAELHGWSLAPYETDRETAVNHLRMLDWALTPDRVGAVRIGIAARDLLGLAAGWELARVRGVEGQVDAELPKGTPPGLVTAVRRDVGRVLLRTPVVRRADLGASSAPLVRLLELNADPGGMLSAVSGPAADAEQDGEQAERESSLLRELDVPSGSRMPVRSHRRQDGTPPIRPETPSGAGVLPRSADTDPSVAAGRAWSAPILGRVRVSVLGEDLAEAAEPADAAELESLTAGLRDAGAEWGRRRTATRAEVVHAAGDAIEGARAALVEVLASETGATIAEADHEVSEAVDAAHRHAGRATTLDDLEHADFVSADLIVVVPQRASPVASAAAGVTAALAAGAAVVVAPPATAERSVAVLVQALRDGGVPRAVLGLVTGETHRKALACHPAVDRVILDGDRDTAARFRRWRADLPLTGETGGTNAVVVCPSADMDLAIAGVVESAFGRAGQASDAASLVILVGPVGRSRRFRRQLVDAVTSIRAGMPDDPATRLGPLVEPPGDDRLRALTRLGDRERWLARPERSRSTASAGRLWSPGLRDRVAPGSDFHLAGHRVPVLGILHADTLEEAIALQNAPAQVSAAAIYSLDPDELADWTEAARAPRLFLNRGTLGASAGPGNGGRYRLLPLGAVVPLFDEPAGSVALTGVGDGVRRLIEAAQPSMTFLEFDRVRTAAESDQTAWEREYGVASESAPPGAERHLVRYRPVPVTIRMPADATHAQLVRVLAAAARARSTVRISSAEPLPASVGLLLASPASPVRVAGAVVEADAAFLERLAVADARPERIRIIGASSAGLGRAVALAVEGDIAVEVHASPVTTEGRIELLPFLREQTIAITAHRFGRPDDRIAFRLPEERPSASGPAGDPAG